MISNKQLIGPFPFQFVSTNPTTYELTLVTLRLQNDYNVRKICDSAPLVYSTGLDSFLATDGKTRQDYG